MNHIRAAAAVAAAVIPVGLFQLGPVAAAIPGITAIVTRGSKRNRPNGHIAITFDDGPHKAGTARIANRDIVLLHDSDTYADRHSWRGTVAALPAILSGIDSRGLRVGPLTLNTFSGFRV